MTMNDDRDEMQPINPHTGKPYTSEVAPQPPAPTSATPYAPTSATPPAPGAAPPASATPQASGEAPSQQEMAVRSALETVMDPEINLSVIDLGLIRKVDIQSGVTKIDMMLTTPFCPYAPQLVAEVKQATESVVAQPCEVELLPDPWSPDLMPDPGLLGYSF
jgi:metal-sulfur cluster biosynthetic enzyme